MNAYNFLFAFDISDCGLRDEYSHDFQVSEMKSFDSNFVLIDSVFSQHD